MTTWWGFASSIIERAATVGPNAPTPTDYMDYNDNWQSVMNTAGAGAVIGMNAGTYAGFSVSPLSNQKFVAVGNVILDGNGANTCFSGGGGNRGIEIWGEGQMNIRDYSPSIYRGAIDSMSGDWYNNPPWADGGWLIDGVDIGPVSGWGGIMLDGNDSIIRHCKIHDIGDLGFKFIFGSDQHIHDTEIYNIFPGNWGNEGGGSKSWGTRRLVHEDMYVHDINGPGLWTDMDNIDTIYRRIRCENVQIANIFHEISGPALVDDCDFVGNPTWVNYSGNGLWSYRYVAVKTANAGTDAFGGDMDGVEVRNCRMADFYSGINYIDGSGRTDQYGNSRNNTTYGEAHHNYVDNCRYNGAAGSDSPTPVVNWHDNEWVNGSGTP